MPEDVGDALDQAVAEINAEGESTSAEEESAEPSSETETATEPEAEVGEEPKGEAEPTKLSPVLQKLLDKYGGDQDKFAEAVWHQYNSAAAIHKRLEELTAVVEQIREAPVKPPEADPEVTRVQEDIEALVQEDRDNLGQRQKLAGEIDKLNTGILKLQGRMEVSDEDERRDLQQDERVLKQELKQLLRDFDGLERDARRIVKEQREHKRALADAEERAIGRVAEARQRKAEEAEVKAAAVRDFISALDQGVKQYDFADVNHMKRSVYAEVKTYLDGLPADAPAVDIEALTTSMIEDYAKAQRLARKKEFANVSKNKANQQERHVAPTPGPTPSSRPAVAPKGPRWSESVRIAEANRARAEAEKLLGG